MSGRDKRPVGAGVRPATVAGPEVVAGPATPRGALAFVRRHGVVLMAARGPVPSLAEAIAGGRFRGSWWGHPQGKLMFRIFGALEDSKDIAVCRLVEGKIAFVHRRAWPALARLASRFPKRALAAVRQEHTLKGAHRNVVTPFPRWMPRAVLAEARRLDLAKAEALLGGALPRRPTGTGRRGSAGGRKRRVAAPRRTPPAAALLLAGVLLASLAGCGPGSLTQGPPAPPPPAATPVDAPEVPYITTYAGDLPCADCAGQRLTLTLFPDQTFRLRRTYKSVEKGRERSVYELGTRQASSGDRSRIDLVGQGEPLRLRFVAGDRLQLLDRNGQPIASPPVRDQKTGDLLALQPIVDAIAGPMPLRGLYTYMADAASFKECATGRTLPVLPVAGSLGLQSAYLAARHKPGAPVFASLTGQFVDRSPEPGAPVREHLIVTQYDRVAPDEGCAPATGAKRTPAGRPGT